MLSDDQQGDLPANSKLRTTREGACQEATAMYDQLKLTYSHTAFGRARGLLPFQVIAMFLCS